MKKAMTDLILGVYPEFLENLVIPEELTKGGACAGSDLNIFFSENLGEINQALQICNSCPIRQQCIDYALFAEEYGVWGGTTQAQRNKMRGGKPVFTLEERRFAVQFRNDAAKLPAAEFARKYEMTERSCFRWKSRLGIAAA